MKVGIEISLCFLCSSGLLVGDARYQEHAQGSETIRIHLYEIGIRVDESKLLENVGGDEKEKDSAELSVDKLFAAERDQIRLQREKGNVHSDRMEDAVNKFTIQIAQAIKGGMTLMDAVFDGLNKNQMTFVVSP